MRRGGLALVLGVVACGCAAPGFPIKEPGGTRGIDVAALPVCADSLPFAGDTTGTGYHGPQATQVMLPEVAARRMRGRGDVIVSHLVGTDGRVVSVVASGVTDPEDLAAFERDARGMRYRPAHFRDCRLQGWATMKLTFR